MDIGDNHPNLFCDSKFWGDPDMPEDMQYPMLDGRPLVFLCQVSCYDIHPFDTEGLLPDDGMLYFFADIDDLLGYDTGIVHTSGEWPKGHSLVKYTKTVNMETFKSQIQVDEDGEPLTRTAQPLSFSTCPDDFAGMRLLGDDFCGDVTLLRIPLDPARTLVFSISHSDLGYGNWKKAKFSLVER